MRQNGDSFRFHLFFSVSFLHDAHFPISVDEQMVFPDFAVVQHSKILLLGSSFENHKQHHSIPSGVRCRCVRIIIGILLRGITPKSIDVHHDTQVARLMRLLQDPRRTRYMNLKETKWHGALPCIAKCGMLMSVGAFWDVASTLKRVSAFSAFMQECGM
ncbi:hypothetical protein KSS87_006148 [Heliosperma pusillum]|nr:hypothetical protein KSS87_006148 [Heliosperma pusillum]